MKKIFIAVFPLILTGSVFAAQNSGSGSVTVNSSQQNGTGNQQVVTSVKTISPTQKIQPTGNQVQNEVQTKNAGDESQLQIATQENLGSGFGESVQIRSQQAIQSMSEVSKQTQQLLQIRTSGGIGDQVKEIAKTQQDAVNKMQENLLNIDRKNTVLKALFGPDYGAIRNINQLMEENALRIEELQQLLIQVTNYADQTQIQETIQSIENQNTILQERIQIEEKTKSLFGWLIRLFIQ